MISPRAKRYLANWWHVAIRDTLTQTFGWASLGGTLLLLILLPVLGIGIGNHPILAALASALASMALAFSVNAFVAVYKARWMISPFELEITHAVRGSEVDPGAKWRMQYVTAIVRNRSVVPVMDCVLHVMNAPNHDGSVRPRQVEKFDLPPKSTKHLAVAYWTARDPPNDDDREIWVAGPHGTFAETISRFPGLTAEIKIRVSAPGVDAQDLAARVWVDSAARQLKVASL